MTLSCYRHQWEWQHRTTTITKKTTIPTIQIFLRAITVIYFVVYNNIFANTYTLPQLQRLVKLSSLSYLPIEKIPSSPYFSSIRDSTDYYQPLHQVVDSQTESGATIFSNDDNNNIVIACRGSATLKNFATNFNFELIPTDHRLPLSNIPDGSRIHAGFQLASWGLWDGVHLGDYLLSELLLPRLDDNEQKQQRTVTFTGHSLGAATAVLCAARASNAGIACDVITFGGPRLCNGILARHLERNVFTTGERGLQRTIVNIVHDADPILANNRVLWDSLGFEVVGREVRCDPGMARVYENEGEGRSWVPAWNFLDHCRYLGVFVGPRLA